MTVTRWWHVLTAIRSSPQETPSTATGPAQAGREREARRNTRRTSDGSRFLTGRPSSVSRTLQVIGDKWSFMVVREAFFGNRRYNKIQTKLEIAPNILTDRLSRLVAQGVFERRLYPICARPVRVRSDQDMGRDLYGPFVAMLAWGDRWLSSGKPPLILTHKSCGHDFQAEVICDACRPAHYCCRYEVSADIRPQGLRRLGAAFDRVKHIT